MLLKKNKDIWQFEFYRVWKYSYEVTIFNLLTIDIDNLFLYMNSIYNLKRNKIYQNIVLSRLSNVHVKH